MHFEIWAVIIGALLTAMALSGTWLRRLPVSTAMLYLAAGYGLGPAGLALLEPDPGMPASPRPWIPTGDGSEMNTACQRDRAVAAKQALEALVGAQSIWLTEVQHDK